MNARMPGRNRAIVERVAAGASLRTVAREFAISYQRVSQIHIHITGERLRDLRPDSWPAERTARLRVLLDEGLRPADIARRLGCRGMHAGRRRMTRRIVIATAAVPFPDPVKEGPL